MKRGVTRLLIIIWLSTLSAFSIAHDARPVSVIVTQQSEVRYVVSVRPPDSLSARQSPALVLPADCTSSSGVAYECQMSLAGRTLELIYPGANPSLSTFFRFESAVGSVSTMLLPPDQRRWKVPAGPSGQGAVFAEYLILGIEHIALGIDHLLFVVCLVVLVWSGERHWRRLMLTITGFTVAHSITLALSVLGVVNVSVALVEAFIALSIVYLAIEILQPGDSVTHRYPVWVASLFGLLHGFGFAAVLREIGLPSDQLVTALLAFNVGVEVGQVLFISVILLLASAVRRMVTFDAAPLTRTGTAYLTGILATFWVIDRTASFWLV